MLLSNEQELHRELADVYEELVYLQETRDVDHLRAPYELVERLIVATLEDDLTLKGAIHGSAYLDDIDMSNLLLLQYTDKITYEEFNTITQRAYRQWLTDYVMGELHDYIDDHANEEDSL